MTGHTEAPWPLAGRVAGRLAGSHPLADSYHFDALRDSARDLLASVEALVVAETGLVVPPIGDVLVVDRVEWAERAIGTFAGMLGPKTAQLEDDMGEGASVVMAIETGALLGVMARRVLGQYELVLPTGDGVADTVVLVGPNVFALERTNQFRPSEFRTWIALHEATHRSQFLGVPWLREYFLGLVTDLVAASDPDPDRFLRVLAKVGGAIRHRRPLVEEDGLFGLFASPLQAEQVARIQALMCLLEGHGHVVMDRIGSRILTSQARMSRMLKARRTDPRMAAFLRLTGMEMKFRQYELGERFVLAVERAAGWAALDVAWSEAEALPTIEEIEAPEAWLRRVA